MKTLVCILVLGSVTLNACVNHKQNNHEQKRADCFKLANLINQDFPNIPSTATPSDVTQAAYRIDQLTQELRQVEIQNESLKQLQRELIDDHQHLSNSLNEFAITFAANTSNKSEKTKADFQEFSSKLLKAVDHNVSLKQKLSDTCLN